MTVDGGAAIRVFQFVDASDALSEIARVRHYLNEHGQCIVRGVLKPTAIGRSVETLKSRFSAADDVRKSLEFVYGQTRNYQRLDIGTYGGDVYQFCRTFLVFPWNDDHCQLVESLTTIARIKNALHELPDSYGLRGEEPVFYGLIIHQYPRGGGFMSGHRHAIEKDHDPGMQAGAFVRHYTVGLVMSKVGADFRTGGGWSMVDGRKVSWEYSAEPGDLVLYDDGHLHGCSTIDLFDPLDLGSMNGRLFGLVSPFSADVRFKGGEEAEIVRAATVVETAR